MKINVDTGVIMQKISFLLLGTSLSFLPQTLNAQCISPIQDCYALGYTQTSCPNGKGVKCPFGSGWYCGGTAAQDCIKLGYDKDCTAAGESGSGQTCNGKYQSCTCDSSYQYTCSGTGYSGGSGAACGGKYTKCNCANGYEWKDGACISSRPICEIGYLYYSDNTCSASKISGKTILGVVIYSNGSSGGGWIISPKPVATAIGFGPGTFCFSRPDLPSYTSTPNDIQASCDNTDIITTQTQYPAAEAAKSYKPKGTPSGKSWCLPSGGLLNTINNSSNLTKINNGITAAGGTTLGNLNTDYVNGFEYIWSSTKFVDCRIWFLSVGTNGSISLSKTNAPVPNSSVRAVMAF